MRARSFLCSLLAFMAVAVAPAIAQQRTETAGEFYERYLAAVETAQTFEELYRFWSDAQITVMKARDASIDIRSWRATSPVLGIKVVRTMPRGQSDVVLFLEGTSRKFGTKATGAVVVTQENGTWKLSDPGGWTLRP
jgi:hypothetical protein